MRDIQIRGRSSAGRDFLDYPGEYLKVGVEQLLQTALENIEGVGSASVKIHWSVANKRQNTIEPHCRVKNILAVASGQAGGGKIPTAVNLAVAGQRRCQGGILDADIMAQAKALCWDCQMARVRKWWMAVLCTRGKRTV